MSSLGWRNATVGKWRQRFVEHRLAGLYDELRAGRPRSIEDEQIAALLKRTLSRRPAGGTHWSIRQAAQASGISRSTVHRLFQTFALQPHRSRNFKLSTDPFFVEKVRDIVGLYLNPPDHALVLCVDEKSQIQALNRTQPVLPMGLGYVEGITHDHVRHGTTTLFAVLDIATGAVFTECKPRHRHQEFLSFLRHLDESVPPHLDLHLIVDNYATHKHPKVRTWLAQRPRYHMHYTPTYSSWLNQVERWFGLITQRAIRRGSFTSVKDLVQKIDAFVQHYNRYSRPFAWTATADSILQKVASDLLSQLIIESGQAVLDKALSPLAHGGISLAQTTGDLGVAVSLGRPQHQFGTRHQERAARCGKRPGCGVGLVRQEQR